MDFARRAISIVTLSGLPRPLQVGIYALVGVAVGVGLVVARLANATSYLSDSPETCMNCHVMTDAYASWQRGSHSRVAVCTDCHVPHDGEIRLQGPGWAEALLRFHDAQGAAGAGSVGRRREGRPGQLRWLSQ